MYYPKNKTYNLLFLPQAPEGFDACASDKEGKAISFVISGADLPFLYPVEKINKDM